MIEKIKKAITLALESKGLNNIIVNIEHPEDNRFGDLSSNVAMVYAKILKMSPIDLAKSIISSLKEQRIENIESIEIAGPGFINFKLNDNYFIKEIIDCSENRGRINKLNIGSSKKIMVEYTDPNPFKIFHIGHLMANTVGESISRIIESSGAEVIRACYQGDVGLHVAKTLWAVMENSNNFPSDDAELINRIKYLGDMYVIGNDKYDTDEKAKNEIIEINKKVFNKSDTNINKYYKKGREWSLQYFDDVYKKLGTKFDKFYFESDVSDIGVKVVKEFLDKGTFEKSDGAIIFPGEKYGEHTRVFINSQGLPTYEAKEIGLTIEKFRQYPDLSESVVITANEQNAYFKVIKSALKIMYPEIESKVKHLSHGILRPASGKMSSRKGNVVSADDLISEFESLVGVKLKDRDFDEKVVEKIKRDVAVAALKFTILRQAIGSDIIYDPDRVISFDGDSGPYLQYSVVRANSILVKASSMNIAKDIKGVPERVSDLEKMLIRFPEIIHRCRVEYAPNHMVTYLLTLSSLFNNYYANNQIIDEKSELTPYRIKLVEIFVDTMRDGLWILGIQVPEKM